METSIFWGVVAAILGYFILGFNEDFEKIKTEAVEGGNPLDLLWNSKILSKIKQEKGPKAYNPGKKDFDSYIMELNKRLSSGRRSSSNQDAVYNFAENPVGVLKDTVLDVGFYLLRGVALSLWYAVSYLADQFMSQPEHIRDYMVEILIIGSVATVALLLVFHFIIRRIRPSRREVKREELPTGQVKVDGVTEDTVDGEGEEGMISNSEMETAGGNDDSLVPSSGGDTRNQEESMKRNMSGDTRSDPPMSYGERPDVTLEGASSRGESTEQHESTQQQNAAGTTPNDIRDQGKGVALLAADEDNMEEDVKMMAMLAYISDCDAYDEEELRRQNEELRQQIEMGPDKFNSANEDKKQQMLQLTKCMAKMLKQVRKECQFAGYAQETLKKEKDVVNQELRRLLEMPPEELAKVDTGDMFRQLRNKMSNSIGGSSAGESNYDNSSVSKSNYHSVTEGSKVR